MDKIKALPVATLPQGKVGSQDRWKVGILRSYLALKVHVCAVVSAHHTATIYSLQLQIVSPFHFTPRLTQPLKSKPERRRMLMTVRLCM